MPRPKTGLLSKSLSNREWARKLEYFEARIKQLHQQSQEGNLYKRVYRKGYTVSEHKVRPHYMTIIAKSKRDS